MLDHLPEELRAQVRSMMSQAYAAETYEVALRQLENLARSLTKAASRQVLLLGGNERRARPRFAEVGD